MIREQQAFVPIFTPYPTPNPNPNPRPPQTVLISEPVVHSSGTDSFSLGSDGLQARPAVEVDNAAALRTGIISQTTDSTTYGHAGGTLSETTKVSTVMHSSGDFGVVTQHVVNDVIVATRQPENFQPVQCEVCNVTCNSGDVLERHKQGKRHFKNLQKLAISSVIAPNMPPPVASAPLVGELENKKHKLLLNGASVDTLIYCDICNVVCNNQDVFRKHLTGKKHSAKATIHLANTNGLPNPTSECSPEVQPSNGSSQKKPETLQPGWCDLCKISCTSNEILSIHLTGKKHLKKLKESEKIPDPSLTPISSLETPPTEPTEKNPESTEGKVVNSNEGKSAWCELCGINCNTYDVLKSHISGKKHLKNLEKSEKPIGPNPAPASDTWINCNTYDVLKSHISGKKHLKNLEKSEKPIGPAPAPAPTPATEPAATLRMIEPLQNSLKEEGKVVNVDGSNRKAKRVGRHEDLETKKQKILQGGAASGALRTCTVCNVVCNSPTVYLSHLAGQKHAAMAVKQAESG